MGSFSVIRFCSDHHRRTWRLAFKIVAVTFLASSVCIARPNILFIMSDDHACQAIGAYGSNRNRTPNIDRMATEGVRFDRCYVTNSICSPSRACILTGKYSHRNGVRDNYTPFDGSQSTFPKLLQSAGYQTALVGKWHLESEPTGFDHWDILIGQGKYYRPDFLSPAGRRTVPGYVTNIISEKALDWLQRKRDPSRPFLLMVHHKAPHRPWDPAPEQLASLATESLPEPATLFDDYSTRAQAARTATLRLSDLLPTTDLKLWSTGNRDRDWLYSHMSDTERAAWKRHVDPRSAEFKRENPQGADQTRRYYQLFIKDYMRCVASVDESVGELLNCLKELGLEDNTLVVYTSDQGFYLGEHGWFDKRFMYEESLRTPLLVRWPNIIEPRCVDRHIVSNVDFAATVLDLADVARSSEMQGRSLGPLLHREVPSDWRTAFYYHYYEGAELDHRVARHEGVTTGNAKLIHFYELNEWELYDLNSDPHELTNLWGRPEHAELQSSLLTELERQRNELLVPAIR